MARRVEWDTSEEEGIVTMKVVSDQERDMSVDLDARAAITEIVAKTPGLDVTINN